MAEKGLKERIRGRPLRQKAPTADETEDDEGPRRGRIPLPAEGTDEPAASAKVTERSDPEQESFELTAQADADAGGGLAERLEARVEPPERPVDGQPSGADSSEAEPPDVTHETQQTRAYLRRVKQQEKIRLRQEIAEAEELERKAKAMAKDARRKGRRQADSARHADRVRELSPDLGFDPSRPITLIPPIEDEDLKQVEFTTVQEGQAYIRILYDAAQNRYMYEAIEPTLNDTETEVLEFIKDTLIRTLDARRRGESPEEAEQTLRDAVQTIILDHTILVDEVSEQRILYYVLRDFLGYGRIDVMMRDPMIEDISCDGPNVPIFIFHRQYESIRSNVVFHEEPDLDGFVIRLAQRSGKHISIAEPLLDATLPDTSRLQATLSREVTTRGSSFTIRKFRTDPLTPPDLVRLGTISAEMAAWFWMAMEEGQSILLAGGTASGKTTSLNAICQFIPPDKKIVSIEDTREINLRHENWIAGLTRTGFASETRDGRSSGAIDMYRLLEAALRQRPEYLLVGEVRGAEALTLFQAMATGHATYSTLHADSITSAVYRLENKPISIPRIMLQTLEAVAVQVQVRLGARMARRLKDITEVTGIDPDNGDLLTNNVFRWDASGDRHVFRGYSHLFEQIMEKRSMSREQVEKEWMNRTRIIEWMVAKGIRHIQDVTRIVNEFYRKPESLLAKVKDAMRPTEDGKPDEREIPLGA